MSNKIKYCKFSITCSILVILLLVFLTQCWFFIDNTIDRMDYTYRFSIKNETNSDLDVTLAAGEIPNAQARFDEFTLIPDEIYKLHNENWSNDYEAHCIVKPNNHNAVVSYLPIAGLGSPLDTYPAEYLERETILRDNLLNKYFSFILTVSRNGEIIYRIAGWDVPDDDMEKYQIDDKSFGYYHTAPESYVNSYGSIRGYPLFYSKLLDEYSPDFIGGPFTYYIKVTSNNAFLQEFIHDSIHIDENKYWKKH